MKKILTTRKGSLKKLLLPLLLAVVSIGSASGATGRLLINGTVAVNDLTQSVMGGAWTWHGPTATLTLPPMHPGVFDIQNTSGNVIVSMTANANVGGLRLAAGNLTITGTNQLTINNTTANATGIDVVAGSLIIQESARVKITMTGDGAKGISVGQQLSGGYITVMNGSSLTVSAVSGQAIDIPGNGIFVQDDTSTADITGNVAGNLTVRGGTVTVSGTVSGKITVTGGSATVNGLTMLPGFVYTELDLVTALRSTSASTIKLGTDITLATTNVQMGADHTLVISEEVTLAIENEGSVNTMLRTLSIEGGGTVSMANEYQNGFNGGGELNLKNINLFIGNTVFSGLGNIGIHVGEGAIVVSTTENAAIHIENGKTLTVATGGGINFSSGGIISIMESTLHIDGGRVVLGSEGSAGTISNIDGLLKYSSGLLEGGMISINEGVDVEGMGDKFDDQGTIFTSNALVTVGAEDAAISPDGLTAGPYIWNGTRFEKPRISIITEPQDAEVTEGAITGSLTVSGTTNNGAQVGYRWFSYSAPDSDITEGESVPGARSSTFPIPTDLEVGTYYYRCRLWAEDCTDVYTRMVTVTVLEVPEPTMQITISTEPGDMTVTEGAITGSLSVAASAENGAQVHYQWYGGDVAIDGATAGTFPIPTDLTAGTHEYHCLLTAEGCEDTRTRTATVTVREAANPDAMLSSLMVSEGTLSPAFNASITEYAVEVAADVETITITATPAGDQAEVSGDTGEQSLSPGENVFTITVTANGGASSTNYTVRVTRRDVDTSAIPVFSGLESEYSVGAPPVTLRIAGTGSSLITTFRVNGVETTEFNPNQAGTHMIEATSADSKLRIWRYVKVK